MCPHGHLLTLHAAVDDEMDGDHHDGVGVHVAAEHGGFGARACVALCNTRSISI